MTTTQKQAIARARKATEKKAPAKAKKAPVPAKATQVKKVTGAMQWAIGVGRVYFAGKDGIVRHVSLKNAETYPARGVDPAKVQAYKEVFGS